MGSERVIPGLQPGIEIEIDSVGNDLVIQGRVGTEIRARGDNENIRTTEDGKRVIVSCSGDCILRVPADATLKINSVGNDAKITDVDGLIEIEHVGNDLVLRDVGPVIIHGAIGSDLEIKRANGDVMVNTVGSDASFRSIAGSLTVHTIGSDALITSVKGDCDIDSIGSDLVFNNAFAVNSRSHFNVGSDVLGKIPADSNVRFLIPAKVDVDVHVPGAKVEQAGDQIIVTLGAGESEVEFDRVGGDFELISAGSDSERFKEGFDFNIDLDFGDDLAEMINRRVNEQIARVNEQIGPMVERVTRQAHEQAERMAQRAERQRDRHGKSWHWSWPEKPKRGEATGYEYSYDYSGPGGRAEKPKRGESNSEPVTNEERMTILRMVENKQISVEEAERLLSALEDGS